jgi:hypothetical protein
LKWQPAFWLLDSDQSVQWSRKQCRRELDLFVEERAEDLAFYRRSKKYYCFDDYDMAGTIILAKLLYD